MTRYASTDAEHAVLAALIQWPDALDTVTPIIRSEDFASQAHRDIFSAVIALRAAHKAVDVVTVFDQLTRSASEVTLSEVTAIAFSAGSRAGSKRYAEIIRAASMERTLLANADMALEIAQTEGEDYASRLERISALFSGMAQRSTRKMPRHIGEIALTRTQHYEDLQEGRIERGWPTGLFELDKKLSGGLRPGKVYVLAARPKVGKTSLAAQIMLRQASDGRPGLVLTQEMPDEEVVDRSIAHEGRVDYTSLLTGQFDKGDEWSRILNAVEAVSSIPLWIDDQAGLTIGDIRTKARSVKGLKVLAIDYLQLCSGSTGKKDANRNTEIEEISRGIKTLAKELGIAVLLLSQLNRKVEERASKRPMMSDLRDSGSIEQDADAIFFLWPVRDLDSGHRVIGCEVAANRSGTSGEFALDFNGAHQRWACSDAPLHSPAEQQAPVHRRRHFEGA